MHNVTAHGATIPALGFGTFELEPEHALRMVAQALDRGYRHIDTAQMYNNEAQVGEAIEAAPVRREEIFLTTKIWVDQFNDGDLQRSLEASLKRLRTEAVDLTLLHWPNPEIPLKETIGALNKAKRDGLTHHIGVSNFTTTLLDEALAASDEPLVGNQVEYHPYLSQKPVLDKVRANGMALTAYSPLAQGKVFKDKTLKRIGEAHDMNPGQITLRWLLQQEGVIAIPRTSREANAKANLAIFDFSLSDAEMAEIHALARPDGRIINPSSLAPEWDVAA